MGNTTPPSWRGQQAPLDQTAGEPVLSKDQAETGSKDQKAQANQQSDCDSNLMALMALFAPHVNPEPCTKSAEDPGIGVRTLLKPAGCWHL
jgi:hypothetical protein